MTESKKIFDRFALRGTTGLAGLIVIIGAAFVLGGFLFGGGGAPVTDHDAADASAEPTLWTCSMHPQIRLPKPGKCPVCFMDLIPLEPSKADELEPRQLRLSEAAKQLARIETTPAVRAFAETEVRMVGRVAYDETNVATITAWLPGRVERLFADFTGATVARGDPMVTLYSPELFAAQEELLGAAKAVEALSDTESRSLRSTAQMTLEAAREKLRLLGLSEAQVEAIETTGHVSDRVTINAPDGGVVVRKDAEEGMYVSTGTRIYAIADLSKLWVMFDAYESDLPWLRDGQRVDFTLPSAPGKTYEASIDFIDPVVDPRTRTVKVRAVVANTNNALKPDMFVRGVVASRIDGSGHVIDRHADDETEEDAPILIPASAPLLTGKRAVVYVEIPNDEGPLFEGREIDLGPRAGDFYVVASGIEEGELVVTNGAFKIDSELQIQARPSMMSPEH